MAREAVISAACSSLWFLAARFLYRKSTTRNRFEPVSGCQVSGLGSHRPAWANMMLTAMLFEFIEPTSKNAPSVRSPAV